MEDNITTALRSNSTDEDSLNRIWYFMLLFALMQLFFFLFCLFMVIYLSIRRKKRAWDSPAKRFGNILNVFISLTFLAASMNNFIIFISIRPDCIPYCILSELLDYSPVFFILTTVFIPFSFSHFSFLYLTAIFVSLLLQIVSPFLNERLKQCTRKTHCAIFTEVVCHILLPVLFIALTVLLVIVTADLINDEGLIEEISLFFFVSFLLILFVSSLLIFAFVVFLIKFSRNQNIVLSIKYMIIKLIFILIIYISFSIASTIAIYFIFKNIFIEFNDHYIRFIFFYCNAEMMIYFIFSILVVSLNHPISCRCRRSPDRAPLLPVNDTEGQQTNPISVWDHRNVPSYTVTNLPYDMSDCRSDYEQLP